MKGSAAPKGFTLIELLVVIAIIAILASILFPVFARARENARRSACMSNVKQILLAFMQYSQDYDERLPHYGDPASLNPNGIPYLPNTNTGKAFASFGYGGGPSMGPGWVTNAGPDPADDYLWQAPRPQDPYVKNSQIYICPSNSGSLLWASGNWGSPTQTHAAVLGNTYAVNTRLIFPDGWKDGRNQSSSCSSSDFGFGYCDKAQNSVNLSQVQHPASTGLIADGYMAWPGRPNNGAGVGTSKLFHEGLPLGGGNGPYKQEAYCVYGFMDGHAKFLNPKGCFYTNAGQLYGGTISFFDDNYKDPAWVPGSYPPNTSEWNASCP